MRGRWWFVGLIAGVVVCTSGTAWALTAHRILTGPQDQLLPYQNTTYLGWTQNSTGRPRHYDAFARDLVTSARTRLNPGDTAGWMGGFDPGTNVAIYQQVNRARSGLYFYDRDTDTRLKVPGVNTKGWERQPKISANFILFVRDPLRPGMSRLILFDRNSSISSVIASWDQSKATMWPGAVGDRYATWTVCGRECNAFYYDTLDDSTHKVRNRSGKPQYSPVIDENRSTLYFVRSGFGCGVNVTIRAQAVGTGTSDAIADLPEGVDTDWSMSLTLNPVSGGMDLLFDRFRCAQGEGDIYALRSVDTA